MLLKSNLSGKAQTLGAAFLLTLAGCGGSGGGSGIPGGGGGNNPPGDTTPLVGTAKFSVNVETGKVQVTPLNGDPTSRAIFSGTSVSFNSSDLVNDAGELTRRKIQVGMQNNTSETLGTPGKGFKVMFGDIKTLNSAATDLRSQTTVSTLIGSGASGSADGPNLGATLSSPHSVLVDNQGGVYFSGYNQNLRVSRNGTVSTLIKNIGPVVGMVWQNDDPQTGIIYASSLNTHRIYKLDVENQVATLIAGTGSVGGDDGPGSTARFNLPYAVAQITEPSANSANPDLLVSEGTTGRLRRLTWDGGQYVVSTLPFTNDAPRGMTSLGNGLFAVSNAFLRKITIFDLNGTKTELGSGNNGQADGDGTAMQFYEPIGVMAHENSLYVSESGGVIRQLTLDQGANIRNRENWRSATIAGVFQAFNFQDGPGDQARFLGPVCMAIDMSGNILVADSGNQRIRQITPNNGRFPFSIGGGSSTTTEKVRVSNATDFVPGGDSNEPTPYIQENKTVPARSNTELTPWHLIVPEGVKHFEFTVTIEAETDSIAPPDAVNNSGPAVGNGSSRAIVRTLAGVTTSGFADGNVSAAAFAAPTSFAYDAQGNLFVADAANHAVRRITPSGRVSTVAGAYGQLGSVDGNGNDARFSDVNGIVANAAGDVLYVTDTTNSTVRRISLTSGDPTVPGNWRVATIGGVAGSINITNGKGALARFNKPWGIVLTTGGDLIVSESAGNRLRRLRAVAADLSSNNSWVVSFFAGDESAVSPMGGSADGTGSAAQFNNPRGMALAPSGEIYLADRDNNSIRKVSVAGVVSTIAGGSEQGYGDSDTGSQAKFNLPNDVAVDRAGYVYVADTGNRVIRRVSPGGTVRTIAGGEAEGTTDGPGNVARFKTINGVEVSNAGDVVVGDATRLRLIERLISSGIVG
jgi:sugar lactone lactonase YvrE